MTTATAWVDGYVVVEILIRLGNDISVTRCKLVCKGWNSLISTPYFLHRYNTFQKHHPNNPCSHDSFTLVYPFDMFVTPWGTTSPMFALSSKTTTTTGEEEDITHSVISYAIPHLKQIKTSCCDLLLLCNDLGGDIHYYVVNMLGWKKLPPAPKPSYSLGYRVGIDYRDFISYSTRLIIKEEKDHNTLGGFLSFKVVCIPVLHSRCVVQNRMHHRWRFTVFGVHIFSSGTNRWTKHTMDWYPFWLTHYLTNLPIVSHNGMLHWLNGHSLVSWDPFNLLPLSSRNLAAP